MLIVMAEAPLYCAYFCSTGHMILPQWWSGVCLCSFIAYSGHKLAGLDYRGRLRFPGLGALAYIVSSSAPWPVLSLPLERNPSLCFFFNFPFPFNSCFLLMTFCCSLPQNIAKQPIQEFCLLLGLGRRLFGNHKATSPGNSSFINIIITIIMDQLQYTHYFRRQNKDNLGFAGEAALEVR